jgi:PhnB protein
MPKKGSPIPSNYNTVSAHLIVRGAEEAIEFYKQNFGARERLRMAGPNGKIMHAELEIGNSVIMLCEESPQMQCVSPLSLNGTPVTIHVYTENTDQVFDRAVKAGAEPIMPPTDMFWGDRYGKLRDPFGHQWAIATHLWDMTAEEMRQAGAEAMKQMQACG